MEDNLRRCNLLLGYLLFAVMISSSSTQAQMAINQGGDFKNVLPMRQRVQIMEDFWKWKRDSVLPKIMNELKVDLWIIRNNEAALYYNDEGPVFTSLLPANHEGMTFPSKFAPSGSQQIPSFLMFHNLGEKVVYIEPRNYKEISGLVKQLDPNRIAISQFQNEEMLNALGNKYSARTIDSWTLGVRWLETMSPKQISIYRYVQGVANDIISEGFSNAVVLPGVTTTDDLNWWFRHKYLELDLEVENHPSVIVKRRPSHIKKYGHIDKPSKFRNGQTENGVNVTIQRGDVISLDSDIMLLGLVTDSHQHAYVLEKGETDIPSELRKALRLVNQMQDLFANEFKFGRTGKEIVAASENIKKLSGVIESEMAFHPPPMYIRRFLKGGYMFSHKTYVAGMTSGPGYYPTSIVTNEHKLNYNTLYAFEPHTSVAVSGWGQQGIELGIGQIAVFEEEGFRYLDRPQNVQWHVIK